MKSILAILILIFAFQICFGQIVEFEGNWYREIFGYDNYDSRFIFYYYTKDDVIRAKEKFNLIKQIPLRNEWEGIYRDDGGSGNLYWNSEGGFVFYRVNHGLGNLDYGAALDKKDSVTLVSEKPFNSNQKGKLFDGNYIKIKFGDKHFLVPEEGIKNFTIDAAGLSTYESTRYLFDYWCKSEDSKKEVFGLPILPEKYKSLLRYPISAEIIKIGRQEIVNRKNVEGKPEKEAIRYYFTINGGKNKGFEKTMDVYISEMKEWAEIDKVSQTSSTAFIQRWIVSDDKEYCVDKNGEEHECGKLSVGMKVQTQTSL